MDTFATMLKQLRVAGGLTQEALAEQAGISTRAVSDLERGVNRTARKDTARLLAAALRLSEVQQQVFEQLATGSRTAACPKLTVVGRLPIPTTPLTGRDAEIDSVCARLLGSELQLLTLTGPGGVGKTRLANAVAERCAAEFDDGALLVDLAPLQDPELVGETIAHALGVGKGESPMIDLLSERLRTWRGLLVLDNFEHVIDASTTLARLLAACREPTVLVTSRRALRITVEHEVPVSPFEISDIARRGDAAVLMAHPAVEIFARRTAAARPGWQLTEETLPTVVELCSRLDGLPLALELAAARTRLLDPVDLLARMTHRLRVLGAGSRDSPERHQTLRTTLDWSYQLLDSNARTTLRRLAVFSGGWTVDAAAAVCDSTDGIDSLDGLTMLHECSMVRHADAARSRRLTMLETIREYAFDQLRASGEADEVAGRHLAWVTELAERAGAGLVGPQQVECLHELAAEHDNLRAALERAVSTGDALGSQRLAGSLWRYWEIAGHAGEGRRLLERAIALEGVTPAEVRAAAVKGAGNMARDQGDTAAARDHYGEARDLFEAAADGFGMATTLCNLGNVALDLGEVPEAIACYEESLVGAREIADEQLTALVLNNLGLALRCNGNHDYAIDVVTESVGLFTRLGNRREIARASDTMGRIHCGRGEFGVAAPYFLEALTLRSAVGDRSGTARSLEGLARALVGIGDLRTAARLLGHAEQVRELIGEPLTIDDRVEYGPTADSLAAAATDPECFAQLAAARAAGSVLPLADLLAGL